MTANIIARLMHVTTQAFLRGEFQVGEYTDILLLLQSQAREAGIGEEAKDAYNRMCEEWHARPAA